MAQYGRPDSDVTQTNWSGGYGTIDESSYSDADYITGASSANGTAEYGLSNVTDPVSSSTHVVRFRAWQQNNSKVRTLNAYLYQGGTLVSSYPSTITLVKGTPTAYNWTLSSGEADAITDYTDLRVRFVSGGDVGTPAPDRSSVYVSWAEVEVPDAPAAPRTIDLDTATITAAGPQLDVQPGAKSINLACGAITATGPALDVQPGAVTVSLDTAQITASGSQFDVQPGAITVSLDAAQMTAAGPALGVQTGDGTLVDIDHEGGDLSEYTSTVDPDGDELNVTEAAALAGTDYGLAVTIDDTDAVYGRYILPDISNTGIVRARIYIDPNTLSMSDGASVFAFYLNNESSQGIGYIWLKYSTAGGYALQPVLVSDAPSNQYPTAVSITDGAHYIEVKWTKASSADANDARIDWWIDGVEQTAKTGVDSHNRWSTGLYSVYMGEGFYTGTVSGTFYLDELVVNDSGDEIGPVGGASPITVNLGVGAISAVGAALDVQPGAVTVSLDAAQMTASGPQLDVQPGAKSISLACGAITAAGPQLDVQPGAVTVSLDAAQITAAGPQASISAPAPGAVQVDLDCAAITTSGPQLDVQPGAVTVSLASAAITAAGPQLDVQTVTTVLLALAQLMATGLALDVVPGARSINLDSAAIVAMGRKATITALAGRVPHTATGGTRTDYRAAGSTHGNAAAGSSTQFGVTGGTDRHG